MGISLNQVVGRETVGKVEAKDMARVSLPYSQVLACPSGGRQSHFLGEAYLGGRVVWGKSKIRSQAEACHRADIMDTVAGVILGARQGAGSGLRIPSSHAWPEVEGTGRD